MILDCLWVNVINLLYKPFLNNNSKYVMSTCNESAVYSLSYAITVCMFMYAKIKFDTCNKSAV